MKPPVYTINTTEFSGSVRLLVDVLQRHQLQAGVLDLVRIVGEYVGYVHDCLAQKYHLARCTGDLPLLGWLILHRSWKLLPVAPPPPSVDMGQDYERRIKQIVEYERFQTLAASLKTIHLDGQQLIASVNPAVPDHPSRDSTPPPLALSHDELLQAWQDVREKLRYVTVNQHNVVRVRWSPAKLKRQMLLFVRGHPGQRWPLATFLLHFAFDLTSLLGAFLVLLEVIYYGHLHLGQADKAWMVWGTTPAT